jgi:hypothetical protein
MTLTDLFTYDASTGHLQWSKREGPKKKVHVFNMRFAGKVAGVKAYATHDKSAARGIVVRIRGMKPMDQYAHRIIWEMVNGPIPEGYVIDHINGNAFDNRLSNLRIATQHQNLQNMKLTARSTCGVKGVSYDKARGLWAAEIRANGVRHRLGRFQTKGLAAVARAKAAIRFHGSFARFA